MGNGNEVCHSLGRRESRPPNPSWGTGTSQWAANKRMDVRAPNPSWGTGTGQVARRHHAGDFLLTPHGERERILGGAVELELGELLTPHGERERALADLRGAALPPPNPSWGTGTAMADWLAAGEAPLLTPHGEREPLASSQPVRSGSPPNPSWGTGTGLQRVMVARSIILLTPHGERERDVAIDLGLSMESS